MCIDIDTHTLNTHIFSTHIHKKIQKSFLTAYDPCLLPGIQDPQALWLGEEGFVDSCKTLWNIWLSILSEEKNKDTTAMKERKDMDCMDWQVSCIHTKERIWIVMDEKDSRSPARPIPARTMCASSWCDVRWRKARRARPARSCNGCSESIRNKKTTNNLPCFQMFSIILYYIV